MSHGNGVGDGWPPSAGRLVRVLFLLSVPEFCVPPLVLLWPKFDSSGVSLFVSFQLSVSGSQHVSLVPMAFPGRSAGEYTLKGVVFVPSAWSQLVSGACESDPKDIVFEVSGGAGRCETDTEDIVSEVSVGAERCGADSKDMVFEASGIPGLCKGSFKLCLVSKLFLQAQCFCFMTTLVVSGIFWKWISGVWQLGSCIFGHVLGLRIVALSCSNDW